MFNLIYFQSPDVRFSDKIKELVSKLKNVYDQMVIIYLSIIILT